MEIKTGRQTFTLKSMTEILCTRVKFTRSAQYSHASCIHESGIPKFIGFPASYREILLIPRGSLHLPGYNIENLAGPPTHARDSAVKSHDLRDS